MLQWEVNVSGTRKWKTKFFYERVKKLFVKASIKKLKGKESFKNDITAEIPNVRTLSPMCYR